MNRHTIIRSSAVAAAVVAMLSASVAGAATLSPDAAACRKAVAKAYAKTLSTAFKTIASCHKARDKGDPAAPADCNNVNDPLVDVKLKFSASAASLKSAAESGCDVDLSPLGFQLGKKYYKSCPVACGTVHNPLQGMSEVGECLGCEAAVIAAAVATPTLGSPTVSSLSDDDKKCHGAIIKGYSKYFNTALKTSNSCQADIDKGDPKAQIKSSDSLTECIDYDLKLKVAGALQKAEEGLSSSCAASDAANTIANLDSCATDLAGLKTCNAADWEPANDEAFTTTYQLPSTICPSAIRSTVRGACSTDGTDKGICSSGYHTGTVLSVGWGGLGHGVDITDRYTLAGDVTCPGSVAGSCGTCTVDGISLDNPQYSAFTRCVNDPSKVCSNVFGDDLACGECLGGNAPHGVCTTNADCVMPNAGTGNACTATPCKYFLGPPLALEAAGTPTCTLNVVNTDVTGTADPDAGTSTLSVDLRSLVGTGEDKRRPCPICQNDPVPLDGNKQGICLGGRNDGLSCDVQAFDLTFAATNADDPHSGNSLDCPPLSGANISGGGLKVPLTLTTGTSSKPAQDDCDPPTPGTQCWCGVCDGDPAVNCEKDADCIGLSPATCGKGIGQNRKPNSCSDGNCNTVPGQTDRGECLLDFQKYCDSFLFANGHGVLPCNNNSDCDSGTCNAPGERVSCFLDPINISGTPDTEEPILAGTFCLPATGNTGIDSATELPGPADVQTDTLVELRYAP